MSTGKPNRGYSGGHRPPDIPKELWPNFPFKKRERARYELYLAGKYPNYKACLDRKIAPHDEPPPREPETTVLMAMESEVASPFDDRACGVTADLHVLAERAARGFEGVKQQINDSVTETKRTIVEFCCGNNSKMGDPKNCPSDCGVVRLTLDDDVTTEKGLSKARTAVKDRNCLLWGSIPCIGGSAWQWVNRRLPGGMKRLRAHRKKWRADILTLVCMSTDGRNVLSLIHI